MLKLLAVIVCLSVNLNSFAAESFDDIGLQKQIHQGLSNFQSKLAKTRADEAFKAQTIKQAIDSMNDSIVEIERMNPDLLPKNSSKEAMVAKIQKDTETKVKIMQSLDPQSLKDMMLMDTQKMQTSQNMMFFLFRGVFTDKDGMYPSVARGCKYDRGGDCGALVLMIAAAPILFGISLGIDLVTLPFTFIASAMTGF